MMRIETLVHDGVAYSMMTPEDLTEAGVPEDVIADAIASIRRTGIKAECRRRIYAVASAETQINMSAAAAAIGAKPVSARSDAEKAMLAAFGMSLDWVQAMRGAVITIASDAALDPASDASWPACPPEVTALAAQF